MLSTLGQGQLLKKLPLIVISAFAYCAVVFLTLLSSFVLAQTLRFSPTASAGIVLGGLFLGIFAGLGLNFALGPLQLKNTLDPTALSPGAHFDIIRDCFQEAGLSLPQLWIIESKKYGHNVVVSGFRFGKGWFQPALFITRSVLESCTDEELAGIIVTFSKKNHVACSSFIGSILLVSLFSVVLAALTSPETLRLMLFFNLVAPVLMTFAALRKQGIFHEIEADSVAVIQFKSSAQVLIRTLQKLDRMNAQKTNPSTQIRVLALQKFATPMIDQRAA